MKQPTFVFGLVFAASSYGACAGTGSDEDSCSSRPCGASSDAGPEMDAPISEVECGTGAVLTLAQWESCTAPRTGPHSIDSSECGAGAIGDEYQVLPSVVCILAPDYNYETNPVRRCDVESFCTQHDECTDAAHGRCVGYPTSYCSFPEASRFFDRECSSDSECADVSTGSCAVSGSTDFLCDPTGACRNRTCSFRQDTCASDADCGYLPGGFCLRVILNAHCGYYDCLADGDCAPLERCACGSCVQSECATDLNCEPGEQCRFALGCFQEPEGYFCSTPLDQCRSSDDCNGQPCEFAVDRWQCKTDCPIPP